ncbi:hypothetical protein [Neisseria maigaei]|uniref:hypothetical protein n=1 Tax=Neisseria maigaei TaxID=2830651 RepID=UPI0026599659|nr:hypothetical protein [Neisseria maigaei]
MSGVYQCGVSGTEMDTVGAGMANLMFSDGIYKKTVLLARTVFLSFQIGSERFEAGDSVVQ